MSAGGPPRPAAPSATPVPRREQASPLSPPPTWPDPYRLLFPIGLAWGLIGAGLWPLHALGLAWPGPAHRMLMIQGFEQSFVLGFLLTAIPGFTRGERCRPWELAIATLCALVFGVAALAGQVLIAEIAFVASVLLLLAAATRRVRRAPVAPPLEMMFVAFGLLLGLAGGLCQLAAAAGLAELAPRVGERLISLGMVLSLVMGVGSLLVPVFAGMRDPLAIPGVAGPHQRRGRVVLYAAVIAAFLLAFVAEWAGQATLGMAIRAAAASVMGLWVWKLYRLPRRDVPAFVLWGSGWLTMLGLWVATAFPAHAVAALHVTFIGGFGLLTLGIATRVVVAHGKHPLEVERRALNWIVVALVLAALVERLRAEWLPDRAVHALAGSGLAWLLAWIVWGVRAVPSVWRVNKQAH